MELNVAGSDYTDEFGANLAGFYVREVRSVFLQMLKKQKALGIKSVTNFRSLQCDFSLQKNES